MPKIGGETPSCKRFAKWHCTTGLIDNSIDAIGFRQRESDAPDMEEMESGSGIGTHLTQTTRTRRTSNGRNSNAIYQGRCDICKGTKKSKFVCSTCKRLYQKDVFIYHHQTGRDCFKKHVEMCHGLSYEGLFTSFDLSMGALNAL